MDDTKKYTYSIEIKKPVLLFRAYNLFGITSIAYFKANINVFIRIIFHFGAVVGILYSKRLASLAEK